MATREQIHALIDALPDSELDVLDRFIKARSNPVLRALMDAPDDDEPLTEDDLAAIAQARAHRARGDIVRDKDLDRELGW